MGRTSLSGLLQFQQFSEFDLYWKPSCPKAIAGVRLFGSLSRMRRGTVTGGCGYGWAEEGEGEMKEGGLKWKQVVPIRSVCKPTSAILCLVPPEWFYFPQLCCDPTTLVVLFVSQIQVQNRKRRVNVSFPCFCWFGGSSDTKILEPSS